MASVYGPEGSVRTGALLGIMAWEEEAQLGMAREITPVISG